MKTNNKNAFTLVELMVVIAIISLLSGIIITNLSGSKAKSRDTQRISDIAQIQLALGLYYDRCNQFPAILVPSANNGLGGTCTSGITLANYIGKIPTPPGGKPSSYDYAVNDTNSPTDYVLHTYLEAANTSATSNGLLSFPSFTVVSWSTASPAPSTPTCDSSQNYCVGSK